MTTSTKQSNPAFSDNMAGIFEASLDLSAANKEHTVTLERVWPKALLIDPAIQRGVQKGEVNKIVSKFNPYAVGVITLSARPNDHGGEDYYVVDGQQRREASILADYAGQFMALVHRNLTLAEEAQLFLDLNFRRAVSAWDQFKNRVMAGEPQALAINEVLQITQVPVGTNKGFMAVSTADKIIREAEGRARLMWALQTIAAGYDMDGNGKCYDGRVIDGFAILYRWHGTRLNEKRLIERIRETGDGIKGLLGLAHTLQKVMGSNISVAVAQALVTTYNKGTHENSRNGMKLAPITARAPHKPVAPTQRTEGESPVFQTEDEPAEAGSKSNNMRTKYDRRPAPAGGPDINDDELDGVVDNDA